MSQFVQWRIDLKIHVEVGQFPWESFILCDIEVFVLFPSPAGNRNGHHAS